MRVRFLLAAMVAGLLALSIPATAAPRASLDAVFRTADCGGGACEPGADQGLKQGARVAGSIQIHGSATSDLRPLEWTRMEARVGDDPRWICLDHWTIGDQQTFSDSYDWETRSWPNPPINSNCGEGPPHYHGELATNGVYRIRLVARERRVPSEPAGDHESTSNEFRIIFHNRPAPPEWLTDPKVSTDRGPSVVLQWKPNPEPDMREYRIVRTGPQSQRSVLVVSAKDPRPQGCTRVGDTFIKCVDDEFPTAFGGTYRYELRAVRGAVGGNEKCRLSGKACISSTGVAREVTISGPKAGGGQVVAPPPTSPAPNPFSGTSTVPQISQTVPGIPTPTTPAAGTPLAAPTSFDPLPGRSAWSVAAVVFVIGWLVWRLRRAILARR